MPGRHRCLDRRGRQCRRRRIRRAVRSPPGPLCRNAQVDALDAERGQHLGIGRIRMTGTKACSSAASMRPVRHIDFRGVGPVRNLGARTRVRLPRPRQGGPLTGGVDLGELDDLRGRRGVQAGRPQQMLELIVGPACGAWIRPGACCRCGSGERPAGAPRPGHLVSPIDAAAPDSGIRPLPEGWKPPVPA